MKNNLILEGFDKEIKNLVEYSKSSDKRYFSTSRLLNDWLEVDNEVVANLACSKEDNQALYYMHLLFARKILNGIIKNEQD